MTLRKLLWLLHETLHHHGCGCEDCRAYESVQGCEQGLGCPGCARCADEDAP